MSLTCGYSYPRSDGNANPQVMGARVQVPLGHEPFGHGPMLPVLRRPAKARRSTMRCLLIVRHGRPGGAEQPVLAPSLLCCNSFAFRARSGRAHFYNRTTIDVGSLLAVRHHSMSKARERGGRVPGFSTGVQTDILVSSQPFRVLRRRSRQAARPVSTTAYPHSTANPVHRPS